VAAALIVAVVGVLVEMVLLRRIYHAPELFQLLATFGLTLMVEDLVVLIWGPSDLLGRRAPGFKGAVDFFGQNIPSYDLFLIALSPVVLGLLWLMFQRTRWGVLVRAATQDRDMVAALGVNQKWLFTSVFALGFFSPASAARCRFRAMRSITRWTCGLLSTCSCGGDRRPRQHHRRLCRSRAGVGAQRIRHPDFSEDLHHFGVPGDGRGADRAAMGLFGKQEAAARRTPGLTVNPWRPLTSGERIAAIAALLVAAALPLVGATTRSPSVRKLRSS